MKEFQGLYGKGLYEITDDLSESKLNNEDLTPIKLVDRNWGMFHYITLWVSIVICITSYTSTSIMIAEGMSWWQAILTVLVANVIVLIPMILSSHSGAKYGLSSPVLLRASFGIYGARFPAILRAGVACLWFGLQTWITAYAIYLIISGVFPQVADSTHGKILGLNYVEFCCYFIVLLLNLIVINGRVRLLRHICAIAAPILVILMIAFIILMEKKSGDWGAMIRKKSSLTNTADFLKVFFPNFSIMIAYWLPLSINIADFTRYAKSQRDHIIGQSFSLPITMTLFALSGIAITSSTFAVFSRYVWDPVEIFASSTNPIVVLIAILGILIAGVTTNTVVNLVAGGMAISSLSPKKIGFKGGALITALLGTLIIPWKLYGGFREYIFSWLVAYATILTPVLGIMLCDYFLIHRSTLNPANLYEKAGIYRFDKGINNRAIIALIIGILPSLPGFLFKMHIFPQFPLKNFFNAIYPYGFFIGFIISLVVYYLLMSPKLTENDKR